MHQIFESMGASQVSDGYYFSEEVGSFMYSKGLVFFNPLGSFEAPEKNVDFFQAIIEKARQQEFKCIVYFEKNSLEEDEKPLYPDFLINLNDSEKEARFTDFYNQNASYLPFVKKAVSLKGDERNDDQSSDDFEFSLFQDFTNNDLFTVGSTTTDKSGACLVTPIYQKDEFFDLGAFSEPASFMKTSLSDVMYVHQEPDLSFHELVEKYPNQNLFYTIDVMMGPDRAVEQEICIFNLAAAENHVSNFYYEHKFDANDELIDDSFERELTATFDNGSFVPDPEVLKKIKADVRKEKMRRMFHR